MGVVLRGAGVERTRLYLGVTEDPPFSNRTIIGEKYGWNGVAWCAETISVVEAEIGNDAFQPSAGCLVLVDRFRTGANGLWLGKPGVGEVLTDDVGFLGSRGGDHVVRVEWVDIANGLVHTIEGNAGGAAHNGGAVLQLVRRYDSFYGFGRCARLDPAPVPAPPPPPPAPSGNPYGPLDVDGGFGFNTKRALQWRLNQHVFFGGQPIPFLVEDGDFGPSSKRALQWYLGVRQDGAIGATTIRALQGHLGVRQDGVWGPGTTRALQQRLNENTF